jgi:hypothetical protein
VKQPGREVDRSSSSSVKVIDRLINVRVRALTVPMHLRLIYRTFVPHNAISVQGSPVPLLKFQMAPSVKVKNERSYNSTLSTCVPGVYMDM